MEKVTIVILRDVFTSRRGLVYLRQSETSKLFRIAAKEKMDMKKFIHRLISRAKEKTECIEVLAFQSVDTVDNIVKVAADICKLKQFSARDFFNIKEMKIDLIRGGIQPSMVVHYRSSLIPKTADLKQTISRFIDSNTKQNGNAH